ncbi:MAG: metallophosphoesterase [Alkalibacterium sp.]|nr:metallophosphoesterase [Alkalibacterium sp.]
MLKSKKYYIGLLFTLTVSIAGYLYWQNNSIEVSYYTYSNSELPEEFDGFKIVQISDTHNKDFGMQLTEKIIDEEPDIIVMTGDLVDRNRTDVPVAIATLEDVIDVAPIYFVSGNHESDFGEYDYLKTELERIGVFNLDNSFENIVKDGAEIGLIGIEDPLFITWEEVEEMGPREEIITGRISQLIKNSGAQFSLLLAHRAELMGKYAQTSVDLAFTGHAHGGQIRLPIVEGIYAPNQGFLPNYTSGLYEKNNTKMVVSRGLGNSIFPFRINNRPELVVVTLQSE